ncbi:hypothetical protein [Roseateles violae]|uniref:Uncharacterized protein n=1 Tax=Roseateles violae TaxID=3058042 RepID=A0ABT8E053_9BURK|nr:hypothetical protein [Pelomonas sp. PFR6]MDN3923222.1 hypothetical protein [Pelomonas sp. PFR6]
MDTWRGRLKAYLRAHGLIAAIAPSRIAVLPFNRPLAPSDRGVVLGWLICQREVVFVRIECCRAEWIADLQDMTPVGGLQ